MSEGVPFSAAQVGDEEQAVFKAAAN